MNTCTSGTNTEHSHIIRFAIEIADMIPNPFKGVDLVDKSIISEERRFGNAVLIPVLLNLLCCKVVGCGKAKGTKTVLNLHENHWVSICLCELT